MPKKTLNSVEIAFIDQGSGPVLLLVHGFPLDHSMWDAQIEAFAEQYRTVAVDLRGFGQSGVGDDDVVEMRQFADDLAALLDSLGIEEPVFLAGLSMGGYVAFEFALKWPQRLRGLILCDTKAMNDTPEVAAERHEAARRVLQDGPASLVESMMPRLFAESPVAESPVAESPVVERPQLVDSLRRVMMETDRRAIAATALGMARRPDIRPLLERIECPTLVIVGQHDAISPVEEMRAIADGISGSQFVEIAGSGHMSPMEKPHEFNAAVLEFMSSITGS